ncbi:hypothetical protein D9Q98_006230 [Chlorella vulgaris]|uniref:Glycosyltransferase family 92 protein n=1 Tax=Chlorella vulgaris TaxID=3077 RepID=A0A9D4TXQ9_CHLVU|nr:hypothetical protein D9Q98_006230 [Chlorella vulgaris]
MATRTQAGRPPEPLAPPSPDDVEAQHKYRKRRRRFPSFGSSEQALLASSVAFAAAGILAGLLFVLAVRKAHDLLVAPQVELLVEQQLQGLKDAKEQQARPGGLLEQHSVGGSLSGLAAGPPSKSSLKAAGDVAAPPGSPSAAGPGSSNFTGQHLAEADRELLRQEVAAMLRALSGQHPWVLGLPEAQLQQTALQDKGARKASAAVLTRGQVLEVTGMQHVRQAADERLGPQPSSNIPGVEDVHAELAAYGQAMIDAMVLEESDAAARQDRSTAAQLGWRVVDGLADTISLPTRIAFLNQLHREVQQGETLRVCLTATTSADVWGVRRELLPWLQYHTELGASRFYLLYDGQDAEAVRLLAQVSSVTLTHIHPPFASPADLAKYALWTGGINASSHRQWGGQPGNYELMVKQGYGAIEALSRAAADGMHWLLHLDPDELLHPGGPLFSLPGVLARVPPHVPAVRFMDFEGQPEAGGITNRYEQAGGAWGGVSLFRVHKHFITPEALFYRGLYKLGASTAFLQLYANGKSAVRVDAPGVAPNGPHYFTGNPSPRWQTADNPAGEWRDAVSDDSVVLHYAYSTAEEVAAKANRSCPAEYLEAARRGDMAKVKQCFVLEVDADAYVAAAQGPAAVQDFFFGRMVLSEGARLKCIDPALKQQGWCTLTDVARLKYLLEKVGLYRRLHTPAALLRRHERDIQRMLRQAAVSGEQAAV